MKINWLPKKAIDQKVVNQLLAETIESGQFTNYGPNVRRLEEMIAKILEIDPCKKVICVCNATAALHALASGINVSGKHGKQLRWATQSFTFPASAQGSLAAAEILDIDLSGGLDLDLIPSDIDGIIVTNIFGTVVDIDKYTHWATKNNKILLFDNAATPFTFYKGKNALNYGHGSIISFHHTKPLGFGEGGAIIVDSEYERAIRRIINFGLDNQVPTSLWDRQGSNYKMSDISAVYIIQYLNTFTSILSKHQYLYRELLRKLSSTDIKLYPNFSDGDPFLSCFCLLSSRFQGDQIRDKCLANGVYCRKYYRPLAETPIALKMYDNILCVPCNVDMTADDLDYLITLVH